VAAFRCGSFQFRAGPYRFVRDSYSGPQVGEYPLPVEASGVMDARIAKSQTEVRS
jgi:hypothetical protein